MSGDPYWSDVKLLAFHENGADATTVFTDLSDSLHTLTTLGDAQWDTAQAPSGLSSSAMMDGVLDAISIPDHANWDLGVGDFTIEGFIRFSASPVNIFIIGNTDAGGFGGWVLTRLASKLDFYYTTGGSTATRRDVDNTAWTPTLNQWYHLAVTRSGADMRMFVDGAQHGTTFNAAADVIFNSTNSLFLGSSTDSAQMVFGWMAAWRITKGIARYTANFTPPTLPYPGEILITTKIIARVRDQRTTEIEGEVEFSIEWSLSVRGEPNGTVTLIQDGSTDSDAILTTNLRTQLAAYVSLVTGQSFTASDVRGLTYG